MLTNQSHDASFPVLLAAVSAEEQERWLSLVKKNGGAVAAASAVGSVKRLSPFLIDSYF